MKIRVLPLTISLSLLSLGFKVLACEVKPTLDAATATSAVDTQPPAPASATAVPALPVASSRPLPRLSNHEIKALQAELAQGIDTWLSLAGISKMMEPPPLSAALQADQTAWSSDNFDVAKFLGTWHDGEGYPYSLSVFPTKTPGQVCVLEFRPEWSLDILNEETGESNKDVISEQILSFSIATVQDGQLRSSQVRSATAATKVTNFALSESYPVMFMSLIDDQGTTRVVALASPPTVPTDLPEALATSVAQTLSDYGCSPDRGPSAP